MKVSAVIGIAIVLTGCDIFFGSNEDKTPPDDVSAVIISATESSISVEWQDPTDDDFDHIIVESSVSESPCTISAGTQLYEEDGIGAGLIFELNLVSVDEDGNRSHGVRITCATDVRYTLTTTWDSLSGESEWHSETTVAQDVTAGEVPVLSETFSINRTVDDEPNGIIVRYRDAGRKLESPGLVSALSSSTRVFNSQGVYMDLVETANQHDKSIQQLIAEIESDPSVEYAVPNWKRSIFSTPNDTYFAYQWNLDQLGMEMVWDEVTGDESVVVAVIDTGVYSLIEDLRETRFVAGWDFVNSDAIPYDDNGHGTHVTGTIAQSTDNYLGAAGMSYGVSIMPLKVLGQDGSGYSSDMIAAIEWAVHNGADVINLSLGGGAFSQAEEDAVRYAYENGVAVIAASGNDDGPVGYPAAYTDYVLAVGATRYDKMRAPYSNYGTELDVVAPGGDMTLDQNADGYSDGILQQTIGGYDETSGYTDYSSGYYFFQGTSMATPHVAALAALIRSKNRTVSVQGLFDTISSTADDLGEVGHDDYFGYGLINPMAALDDFDWNHSSSSSGSLNQVVKPTETWQAYVTGALEVAVQTPSSPEPLFVRVLAPNGVAVASGSFAGESVSFEIDASSLPGEYAIEVSFGQ